MTLIVTRVWLTAWFTGVMESLMVAVTKRKEKKNLFIVVALIPCNECKSIVVESHSIHHVQVSIYTASSFAEREYL